jgi:hypothetical protein
VREAFGEVMALLGRQPSIGPIGGCLVQAMAGGEAELIVKLNPLLVRRAGGGVIAVDGSALIGDADDPVSAQRLM